jgi:hypothetical protein
MRLSTVLWRDDGRTETEIAHLLGICTRTVRHWFRLYRQKGLDALCTLHPGFPRWVGRFGMAFAHFPLEIRRFPRLPAETTEEPNG